jgi:ribonuclease HI
MKIYCDSSLKEVCLVVVLDDGSRQIYREAYRHAVTNNVGEYRAVIWALTKAKICRWKDVEILTDSQLVVEQVNGAWMCRKAHLKPLLQQVRELLGQTVATLRWVPREENLAGQVLG